MLADVRQECGEDVDINASVASPGSAETRLVSAASPPADAPTPITANWPEFEGMDRSNQLTTAPPFVESIDTPRSWAGS